MDSRFALLVALVCGVFSAACPAPEQQQRAATDGGGLAKCARFGQTCEFSPGKLGSCVERASCAAGEECFVCQSQH